MKNKGRGKATLATVFIDGVEVEAKKAAYPGSGPSQAANSDVASQICFRIGTAKRDRCEKRPRKEVFFNCCLR